MSIDPTTRAAERAGFTRAVYLEGDYGGFAALIEPDADLDDRFRAFDTDNQEWVDVSGWLLSDVEELDA